jgi:hypothetical protein
MGEAMKIPKDPVALTALAQSPTTPLTVLEELAKSPLPFVVEYVAKNPNTTSELLTKMMPVTLKTERELRIARALLTNQRLPVSALELLLNQISPEQVNGSQRENHAYEKLVLEILCHINCDERALKNLAGKQLSIKLRQDVAKQAQCLAVLKHLVADSSGRVREIANQRLAEQDGKK